MLEEEKGNSGRNKGLEQQVQAQMSRYQETRTGIVGFSSTIRFSTGSRAGELFSNGFFNKFS